MEGIQVRVQVHLDRTCNNREVYLDRTHRNRAVRLDRILCRVDLVRILEDLDRALVDLGKIRELAEDLAVLGKNQVDSGVGFLVNRISNNNSQIKLLLEVDFLVNSNNLNNSPDSVALHLAED